MNYSIFDAIQCVLINRYDIQEFIDFIERERGESNLTFLHASNILIGSHDTDRIFTSLGHDENKFLSAMSLLLFIPGSPIIYYGDEKMMEGGSDPDCRRGMIFDENYHKEQFEIIKRLIKLKHLEIFKTGDIRIINQGDYIEMIRFNDSDEYHLYFTNYHDVYIYSLEYEYDLVREEQSDGNLKQYQVIITKKDKN